MIIKAKKNNPDCVVVYFVKHKNAPNTLKKATNPMYHSSYYLVFYSKEKRKYSKSCMPYISK